MADLSAPEWTIPELPVAAVLPALKDALSASGNAVLEAPPGAGKTTLVPLALLNEHWLGDKRILMLEPRRIAARAAARRMASMIGEDVGQTVGYRMRFERKVSARTRIEVVTEGMLIRDLQRDPALEAIGLLILDEFHERSLDADLSLALALEAQGALRDDLRILVMSATLDGGAVADLLDAPLIRAEGRMFPVTTRYLPGSGPRGLVNDTAQAVRVALREESGSLLVFLPGVGEIRRVAGVLEDAGLPADTDLCPLYGDLTTQQQDAAIAPAPEGRRKVVLATAIAETSLTIDGIRVVIDAGRMRGPAFDPTSGMTRLVTTRVSAAAATQRRGRAGRIEPGVCYRLWAEAEQNGLIPHTPPEIENADLCPLVLELANWGTLDPATLRWMTPPPAAAVAQARDLLRELGGLDRDGRITPHGRAMAGMPTHPRLAHMILTAVDAGLTREAALVAALLGERDIMRPRPDRTDADIRTRLSILRSSKGGAAGRVVASAQQLLRNLSAENQKAGFSTINHDAAGRLVALAYPDRVARRRTGPQSGDQVRYRMANGRGAVIDGTDPLAGEEFLAVATLGGDRREGRVFLAAPLTRADVEDLFADLIVTEDRVRWDNRNRAVDARRITRFEALELNSAPLTNPDPDALAAAVIEGLRVLGPDVLPWKRDLRDFQARVAFCRRHDETNWPDLSDAALTRTLEEWLAPYLGPILKANVRVSDFGRIDLGAALFSRLDWTARQALDRLAPTHVTVPSGSRVRIDYNAGEVPVLAVRLQEMFGALDTPRIMDGRVPVLIHLLSPARRPVQITRDLATFWQSGYGQVKAELKGRYPKHYWPDDPLRAEATAKIKPKPGKR